VDPCCAAPTWWAFYELQELIHRNLAGVAFVLAAGRSRSTLHAMFAKRISWLVKQAREVF